MSVILVTGICRRHLSSIARKAQTRALIDRVLRVDHAGEIGAVRIYQGQLAVLGRTQVGPVIDHLLDQERVHAAKFEELIPKYRARPTVLLPVWNVAGFLLGAGSALLGKEAAMACTVAVETAIGEHYDGQLRTLMADGPDGADRHKEIIQVIKKFRDEELDHLETGLEHDAEKAPLYDVMNKTIQAGCKVAIWLAERV
ncbi:hypothetical protein NP493_120g04044 [Ridgeia piscesae]|uniref:5-demethoxyubiquinone hydroxylase, mitochondrial n=1 Tax=Ridgeia piscesae TaxID=27915 RepID=A0AAD9P6D3_RIDPI|nr:hypothetical protein NP493_120g04044 [Ridgeia piscesae]